MNAAVYCRVSTLPQEEKGTSLTTQLEACRKRAEQLGYADPLVFKEAFSGLTRERPQLEKLRELIRSRQIDCLIVYSMDRLSRNPTDFIILQEEMEKHQVRLELVTETADSSELGKLISHVKTYAANMESEKIKERSIRGRKETAQAGTIPSGCLARLYGYSYGRKGKGGDGKRHIDSVTSEWVIQMFHWLVDEQMSTQQIATRLNENKVITPTGDTRWVRSTVLRILKNRGYIGETFYNTSYRQKNPVTGKVKIIMRPRGEWIDIPGVTPPLIDPALFERAQRQLRHENTRLHAGHPTHKRLLQGLVKCGVCGRAFWAFPGGKHYRYSCASRSMDIAVKHCGNRTMSGRRLEAEAWQKCEHLMEVIADEPLYAKRFMKRPRKANIAPQLAAVTKRLEKLAEGKRRATNLFVSQDYDESQYKNKVAYLDREIAKETAAREDLERRLTEQQVGEAEADAVVAVAKELAGSVKTLDYTAKRDFLIRMKAGVEVFPDRIDLRVAVPIDTALMMTS